MPLSACIPAHSPPTSVDARIARAAVLAMSGMVDRGGVSGRFRTIGEGEDRRVVFFADSSPSANSATRAAYHKQQAEHHRFLASKMSDKGDHEKAFDHAAVAKEHDKAAQAHESTGDALKGKPSPVSDRAVHRKGETPVEHHDVEVAKHTAAYHRASDAGDHGKARDELQAVRKHVVEGAKAAEKLADPTKASSALEHDAAAVHHRAEAAKGGPNADAHKTAATRHELAARGIRNGVSSTDQKLRTAVARQKSMEAAKAPDHYDADAAGTSNVKPGLFGQPTVDPIKGTTGSMFDNALAKPTGTAVDQRLAKQYDPKATPMLPGVTSPVSSYRPSPVNRARGERERADAMPNGGRLTHVYTATGAKTVSTADPAKGGGGKRTVTIHDHATGKTETVDSGLGAAYDHASAVTAAVSDAHAKGQTAITRSGGKTAGGSPAWDKPRIATPVNEGRPQGQAGTPERFYTAKHSVTHFAQPFVGPSGATVNAYEWRHVANETGRNVSDWSQSEKSDLTGKDLVHHFQLVDRGGQPKLASLESAMSELGYADGTTAESKAVRNIFKGMAKQQIAAHAATVSGDADGLHKAWDRTSELVGELNKVRSGTSAASSAKPSADPDVEHRRAAAEMVAEAKANAKLKAEREGASPQSRTATFSHTVADGAITKVRLDDGRVVDYHPDMKPLTAPTGAFGVVNKYSVPDHVIKAIDAKEAAGRESVAKNQAANESRQASLKASIVPSEAKTAFDKYKGNADAAWNREDETASGLISRYGDAIRAGAKVEPAGSSLSPDARVRVGGNTYPHKDSLKRAGFKYDGDLKSWIGRKGDLPGGINGVSVDPHDEESAARVRDVNRAASAAAANNLKVQVANDTRASKLSVLKMAAARVSYAVDGGQSKSSLASNVDSFFAEHGASLSKEQSTDLDDLMRRAGIGYMREGRPKLTVAKSALAMSAHVARCEKCQSTSIRRLKVTNGRSIDWCGNCGAIQKHKPGSLPIERMAS